MNFLLVSSVIVLQKYCYQDYIDGGNNNISSVKAADTGVHFDDTIMRDYTGIQSQIETLWNDWNLLIKFS